MAFLEVSMKFYPNTSYLFWVITSSGSHDTKSPHRLSLFRMFL